jgi:hypothetical protein
LKGQSKGKEGFTRSKDSRKTDSGCSKRGNTENKQGYLVLMKLARDLLRNSFKCEKRAAEMLYLVVCVRVVVQRQLLFVAWESKGKHKDQASRWMKKRRNANHPIRLV